MTAFLRRYGVFLLLGITLLAFLPSLAYAPIHYMDDDSYVFQNRELLWNVQAVKTLLTKSYLNLYTPLQMASYLVDYSIGGLTPWVYRLHNILWHLLASWFVWRFFREVGISRITALFCAAAFALHPQRVESVVWIAERKDVLATTFFVAAMCFFLAGRRHGKLSIASMLCMLAALLSKPQAIALPAVLYLLEVHRARIWWSWSGLKSILPYCAISGLYTLVIASTIQSSTQALTTSAGSRLHTVALVIRNYLRFLGKTFLPMNLSPLYPFFFITREVLWYLAGGLCALFGALGWLWYRHRGVLLYDVLPFLLCFGGILLPVSGVVDFSNADYADRYSYVASIFLLAIAGIFLDRLHWRRYRFWLPAGAAYLGVLFLYLQFYMPAWRNDESFFRYAADDAHPNHNALMILSALYIDNGKYDEAAVCISQLSDQSPRYYKLVKLLDYYRLIVLAIREHHHGDRETARQVLQTQAQNTQMRYWAKQYNHSIPAQLLKTLGTAELQARNPEGAAQAYTMLADDYPDEPFTVAFYRGLAAMLRRNYADAEQFFQQAHQLRPNDAQTAANLAAARNALHPGADTKP